MLDSFQPSITHGESDIAFADVPTIQRFNIRTRCDSPLQIARNCTSHRIRVHNNNACVRHSVGSIVDESIMHCISQRADSLHRRSFFAMLWQTIMQSRCSFESLRNCKCAVAIPMFKRSIGIRVALCFVRCEHNMADRIQIRGSSPN
jgi:hypothetical protein